MKTPNRVRACAIGVIGILGVAVVSLAWSRMSTWSCAVENRVTLTPLRSPFEEALREARGWRLRALMDVNNKREVLEEWDPDALEPPTTNRAAPEKWRLEQMAPDRAGYLLRAREAAERAAALARTPGEAYRAAEHLARIEHERGHHEAELRHARKMTALAERNEVSRITLQRALACNRRRTPAHPPVPVTAP